jgi:hypothetical protein
MGGGKGQLEETVNCWRLQNLGKDRSWGEACFFFQEMDENTYLLLWLV